MNLPIGGFAHRSGHLQVASSARAGATISATNFQFLFSNFNLTERIDSHAHTDFILEVIG
jgi:hypothetical protein